MSRHRARSCNTVLHNYIQWNLSIVNTIGTQLAVLYREVSLTQRKICTQLYVVGTADSVLIREVSLIQSALYREDPLYFPTACNIIVQSTMFSRTTAIGD